MSNAGFKQQDTGLTWVEVLVTLAILSILFSASVSHWRGLQTKYAERRLLNDVGRALAYARNKALLQAETLVLIPRVESEGWSSGMVLEFKHPTQGGSSQRLHTWRWHYPNLYLSWHGFLGDNAVVIEHRPAKLAMNGYFLLKSTDSHHVRWVVSRFGRIRAEQS
ncbi:MAG: prepilin-type N-terminal cleavage/methylation domain-containing protein [Legionellaceae bacterium]|nr:prepilin-type N-terminal cleavage/methylation domain-containing protein [Legionellaceae bacterium]